MDGLFDILIFMIYNINILLYKLNFSYFKEHERKHTGDMKYSCEVCGKKFYIQAHMKRHMYSHTGLKPHVCRWKCGLTFASYGGRMKHERINHYEENPLETNCDVCGRPFRNQE